MKIRIVLKIKKFGKLFQAINILAECNPKARLCGITQEAEPGKYILEYESEEMLVIDERLDPEKYEIQSVNTSAKIDPYEESKPELDKDEPADQDPETMNIEVHLHEDFNDFIEEVLEQVEKQIEKENKPEMRSAKSAIDLGDGNVAVDLSDFIYDVMSLLDEYKEMVFLLKQNIDALREQRNTLREQKDILEETVRTLCCGILEQNKPCEGFQIDTEQVPLDELVKFTLRFI